MAKIQNRVGTAKLKEMAEEINICLFCTDDTETDVPACRPMSTQTVDKDGCIWFFSSISSGKNSEIEGDNNVRLYYSHPTKSKFLVVYGVAEIIIDRKKIEELWTPLAKTWFKDGVDDPDISLIKVHTRNAHYWDVDGNKMVNFFKMIASVATGKNLLSAKEGTIKVKRKVVANNSKKAITKTPVKNAKQKTTANSKTTMPANK